MNRLFAEGVHRRWVLEPDQHFIAAINLEERRVGNFVHQLYIDSEISK